MFKNAKVVSKGTSPDAYHDQPVPRGNVGYPVSPSALKEFARCPNRWVNGYESPESDAKQWGSLIDCLLLTPDQFDARYAVVPQEAPKKPSKSQIRAKKPSPDTIAAIAWWKSFDEAHPDCEIVSSELVSDCWAAIKRLRADSVIASFLDASDTQVLVNAEWHDPKTGLVIPARCLMDLVPRLDTEFAKCLGDLKTGRSAALTPFQRQCFDMSWHVQGAFDTDLYVAATGEDRNSWCFVVQENFSPWQPGKRLLSQAFLDLGRSTYRRQLSNYCLCLKTGVWPGYDDHDEAVQSWSIVDADPWMESKSMFDPRPAIPEAEPELESADIVP